MTNPTTEEMVEAQAPLHEAWDAQLCASAAFGARYLAANLMGFVENLRRDSSHSEQDSYGEGWNAALDALLGKSEWARAGQLLGTHRPDGFAPIISIPGSKIPDSVIITAEDGNGPSVVFVPTTAARGEA